jgi:hypothetical protein
MLLGSVKYCQTKFICIKKYLYKIYTSHELFSLSGSVILSRIFFYSLLCIILPTFLQILARSGYHVTRSINIRSYVQMVEIINTV